MKRSFVIQLSAGLAAGSLFFAPASSFAIATPTLSVEQQSQVTALVAKLLSAAKALPDTASSGAFEGAFADAATGFSNDVIAAAMGQIQGTPGLPANAKLAAGRLQAQYASNRGPGGTGALGGLGNAPFAGAPGYSGGGGGGSSYGH